MSIFVLRLRSLLLVFLASASPAATTLVHWDFAEGTHGWRGNPRVDPLRSTSEGLVVQSRGHDPWIEGPAFDAPPDSMLRVTMVMQSRADSSAEVFYGPVFQAGRSKRFAVDPDGQFHAYTLVLPEATGAGTRLRVDPLHGPGRVVIRRILVESIRPPSPPPFGAPALLPEVDGRHVVRHGDMALEHHPGAWNGWRLHWGGRELARGYDGELIGRATSDGVEYLSLKEGRLRWMDDSDNAIVAETELHDRDGANWKVRRRFAASPKDGSIEVITTVEVDQDRAALLLPWFTLLPGHGSFGQRKHQGLFAGLEYLADEPSSSQADLTVADHQRRIPDPVKLTFPLMAIEHDGLYVGLTWDSAAPVAAGFDSPDRVFGSQGHAMWLSGPGVGQDRFENSLVAHSPIPLKANQPRTVRATLMAGAAPSVIGAVQHYLTLRPLPALPPFPGGYEAAIDLLAHGWLDSTINEEWLFQHAEWMGNFPAQPAADAAMFMSWLATQSRDPALVRRLEEGAGRALERLRPDDPHASAVSHVRLPVAPLRFGRTADYVRRRQATANDQLSRFEEDGRVVYRPGQIDYGRTHFADHANGLGGALLADILEAALLSAEAELTSRALSLLDLQTSLYDHAVPRGAQTWEVPLHTPDILASAHMVRAYVHGYRLTGREAYLEQARDWAWTGVPFVYLVAPTEGTCGPYATIAVLGATNWKAPVWLGQPVQWCGLVYASALHLLSRHDPTGPWRQLARGITLAGLQMTWPLADPERQGLLPDYFLLERQVRDGPAINPGTVGAHLPEAFGRGKIYDSHRFNRGWIVHAPCKISDLQEDAEGIRFSLTGWGDQPYRILVAGAGREVVRWQANGKVVRPEREGAQGATVLPLRGPARLEARWEPEASPKNIESRLPDRNNPRP